MAVETLCCDDANLLTADVTINFMLDELSKQNTSLSKELLSELILRIQERRSSYSDVLQFLHNPDDYNHDENYDIFNLTSKSVITKLIIEMAQKFNLNNTETDDAAIDVEDEENDDNEDIVDVEESATSQETLKEKLHNLIKSRIESRKSRRENAW